MVSKMLHFPGNVWIGMTREANSQQFKWSDLSLQEYSHWSKGQPGAPGASKMCVFASNSTNNDGRWVVADCGQKNGFMCQINKGMANRFLYFFKFNPTNRDDMDIFIDALRISLISRFSFLHLFISISFYFVLFLTFLNKCNCVSVSFNRRSTSHTSW